MKSTLLALLTLLSLALAPTRAADDARLARLTAADDERVAAVVAGDQAKLGSILSDELHYTHSSGVTDDKASFLSALAAGRLRYVGISYEERTFTFPAPKIALMTGRAKVEVAKPDGKALMTLSFLSVWREEAGQWRFLAWQSCKLPDAAPAKEGRDFPLVPTTASGR